MRRSPMRLCAWINEGDTPYRADDFSIAVAGRESLSPVVEL